MPEAWGRKKGGMGPAHDRARLRHAVGPVEDLAPAHNFLDFSPFFATVQGRQAGLVFAIWPPIFCSPVVRKPVSNPKAF
jgi:hypothetical protein